MRDEFYYFPYGYEGKSSDIKWCDRRKGGKYCLLCGHYAKFSEWSKEWKWYYLISWHDDIHTLYSIPAMYPYLYNKACWQFYRNWRRTGKRRSIFGSRKWPKQPRPKRYSSKGLTDQQFKSLLKKGCKNNKKCKCISLVQRGNWYCQDCYKFIHMMANHKLADPHDIMIMSREELKRDLLMLTLSGVL